MNKAKVLYEINEKFKNKTFFSTYILNSKVCFQMRFDQDEESQDGTRISSMSPSPRVSLVGVKYLQISRKFHECKGDQVFLNQVFFSFLSCNSEENR